MEELDEIAAVRTLSLPQMNQSRDFSGLSALKMDKKDRHVKTLYEFAKFLEVTNESVVQEVLNLTRNFRETMEVLDEELEKFCADVNEDDFLIPRNEKDLLNIRDDLITKIQKRSEIVEKFAADLDNTETKRANVTGAELKRLVDKLISIAHQLPDDIEHIVEAEAFELNAEIINNKNAHAHTMADHRIRQIKFEDELLQKWEASRKKWRELRHEKALNDFRTHIASDEFTDPYDRQEYMREFREGQDARRKQIQLSLNKLRELLCNSITSEKVSSIQHEFTEVNELEMEAIQNCYNRLTELRNGLAYYAQERVESLRHELHIYGALKIEPDLESVAQVLQGALEDESLSELWRLGGGLKMEFQAQVADMRCDEVIYARVVDGMRARLDTISCSFGLKAVLEERGRGAQLDKVRGLITKMRTAPRSEMSAILRSLLPELETVEEIDQLPELFRSEVRDAAAQIAEELADVEKRVASAGALASTGGGPVSVSGGSAATRTSSATGATRMSSATGRSRSPSAATGTLSGTAKTKTLSKTQQRKLAKEAQAALYPDPTLVKGWNRRLGILYYASDLPEELQAACGDALRLVAEQEECNSLTDAVISEESDAKVRRLDRRYQKLIEAIANFLENQATLMSQCTSNLGEYFLRLARLAEGHRAEQKRLDDKSADEIWDLKEEFRFEREDREAEYEAACQRVRESTTQEELQGHFEDVLRVLEQIQQSYRDYHARACFANDRYPLMLLHDFRGYLNVLCENFFLLPAASHQIVGEYERVFDETVRLNRKFFDEDPNAAGVGERIPPPPQPGPTGDKVPTMAEKKAAAEAAEAAAKAAAEAEDGGGAEQAAGGTEGQEETEGDGQPQSAPPQELKSPILRQKGKLPPRDMNTGLFYWLYEADAVEACFRVDGQFANPEQEQEEEGQAQEGEQAQDAGVGEGGATLSASQLLRRKEPHPDCPFVAKDCPSLPLPSAEVAELHPDDREDYEVAVAKHFILLDDEDVGIEEPDVGQEGQEGQEGVPATSEELPLSEALAELAEEQVLLYRQTKRLVRSVKARQAEQATPSYVQSHPPLDPQNEPWVKVVDISAADIKKTFAGIRDSFLSSLELESKKRILTAEGLVEKAKKQLTEELEERVRNHWPRRGRVETQIKQPREAELLGHKEKTWRHITSIQQKMVQAQESMDECVAEGQVECDQYVTDMAELCESLSGDFKNLASLQGIDVRARSTTQSFQALAVQRLKELTAIARDETDAIMFFARDFRKICPPQVAGQEGGYSPSEIAEIEQLVEGQCAEIQAVSEEWLSTIAQVEQQQINCFKKQEEFTAKYKQCTQDVAMSEGLGQKYGAPRRRAQERLRTEVSRDEARAGKIDSMLANLEFVISEADLCAGQAQASLESSSSVGMLRSGEVALQQPEVQELTPGQMAGSPAESGKRDLYHAVMDWNLLVQLRLSLQQRVGYLRVAQADMSKLPDLPWLSQDRVALCAELGADNGAEELAAVEAQRPGLGLEELFEDVDKTCRAETRQLYESEGQAAALGEGGVPEALQHWLQENREKVLGRHGYRERAWKRLWTQVQRSEDILARHLVPVSGDAAQATVPVAAADGGGDLGDAVMPAPKYKTKLGAPAICMRALARAFVGFAKQDMLDRVAEFAQLLKVWEKGREKHERLLRPRLGSPDVVQELNELDAKELQRSAELVENVHKFRSQLIRAQTAQLLQFITDVSRCSQGLMTLLDSTVRQEQLQVPPDTAVPKKHMTLKKLRKAQRVKEAVAQGAEDRSQSRRWAGIDTQLAAEVVRISEDLVTDLGSDPADTAVVASSKSPRAPEPPGGKGKAAKKPDKGAPPPEAPKPSLIPAGWVEVTKEESALQGLVSTAHRVLISERDSAIHCFTQYLAGSFEELRSDYDSILRQEQSWNERWRRQVEMLRQGNL